MVLLESIRSFATSHVQLSWEIVHFDLNAHTCSHICMYDECSLRLQDQTGFPMARLKRGLRLEAQNQFIKAECKMKSRPLGFTALVPSRVVW